SSNSISMLPSEPKIFHGRESELSDILHLFNTGIPRIAILGAGGMGKTSLARAVLHQPDITARYVQNRFFVACNSATTKLELVNLIGGHLGLKPAQNLTQAVLQYFSNNPPSLLILDELETLWEPASSRASIEELLSLLTGVEDLALMITMRGADKPAKVLWTRPFLQVLQPLDQEAARHTFVDIADSGHSLEEVDQILSLADNVPHAISLLAHLADTEGCSNVLFRWDKEKTSVISEGFDKRLNLNMSISLSLSSPRIQSIPHSQELLSLLAMLPDGLADVDLIQSELPLENILKCKTALESTSLAYSDEHKRLKVLMPIREYLQQYKPPGDHLIRSLLKYFQDMLKFHVEYHGTQLGSSTITQVKSNLTNIHNVLQWGLKQNHPVLSNSIYCVCYFSQFSELNMQVQTSLMGQIQDLLPQLNDHHLKSYFLIESIRLWQYYPISDPEALASQVVELFKDFDDPDLKCRFYLSMSGYYHNIKNDLVGAVSMCKRLISLAIQTGNTRRYSHGLSKLAWINIQLGTYSEAQMDACKSQKLSRVSGDLYGEADAVHIQALCWKELGHYKQSLSLSIRAQSLLNLCGMAGGDTNCGIMST
ncbi:P-loop containing nucleoside triphosphate hydrolase protein, partial [Mycena albidolilacea]